MSIDQLRVSIPWTPVMVDGRCIADIPLTEAIHAVRLPQGKVISNVPWYTVFHSPDGYNYGFYGSGPADFALNILEAALHELGWRGPRQRVNKSFTCFDLAMELHQGFKRDAVARLDFNADHVSIPWGEVLDWMKEHSPEFAALGI